MSKAKFAAVKELVEEGHYDTARAVLRTLGDDDRAFKWLYRIDEIDPPIVMPNIPRSNESFQKLPKAPNLTPPQYVEQPSQKTEQELYYERENRRAKRRHRASGLELIMTGIAALGAWFFVWGLRYGNDVWDQQGVTGWLMMGMGVFAIYVGLGRLFSR